jgi:hypothetical protein
MTTGDCSEAVCPGGLGERQRPRFNIVPPGSLFICAMTKGDIIEAAIFATIVVIIVAVLVFG